MRHWLTALAALTALALVPGICSAQRPAEGTAVAAPPPAPPASTAQPVADTPTEDDISCGPSE
jgi:hypothetical protein